MTNIQWTDETWNPTTGCSVVSPGCTNCYAMRQAGTRLRDHPKYKGLTQSSKAGPIWTGEVRMADDETLTKPLRWRKSRMIFVDSMSDLFHEDVPFEFIDRVFAVMALCPQHTFQVLTKRPERMRKFLSENSREDSITFAAVDLISYYDRVAITDIDFLEVYPYPNVWLGTSVEDQTRAGERIPHLLDTPAAVRFVSYEPALGPVDFSRVGLWLCKHWKTDDALPAAPWCPGDPSKWWWERQALRGSGQVMLDWIIVGGESGHAARPFHLEWAYQTIEQCRAAGAACFVKQLGSRPFEGDVEYLEGLPVAVSSRDMALFDAKGGDPAEWPEDLRVREFPNGQ